MNLPESISRYRLVEELGRGGMGVVFRAEDPQLGRPVAVKLILFPPQADDPTREQLEQRFAREARAAAAIRHPGVITVYDFGRDGDYLFLVMELIEGPSLADRLRDGWRPDRTEAFETVARVAEGLAAAHAAGVVHRDVTPRNILLAPDGRVVVTDFGLARGLGEETHELTQSGMIVGSPRYMAPELVRGQPCDGRADLFSLGVVLFLLLSGRSAFEASDVTALLYQIVHEDPLADPEVRSLIFPEAMRCLERCLAKDPEQRYASAEEMARDVHRLADRARGLALAETATLGVPADAVGGEPEPVPTESRRAGLLVAGVGILAIAALGFWRWAPGDGTLEEPAGTPGVAEVVAASEPEDLVLEVLEEPSTEEASTEEASTEEAEADGVSFDEEPPPPALTEPDPPPPTPVQPTPTTANKETSSTPSGSDLVAEDSAPKPPPASLPSSEGSSSGSEPAEPVDAVAPVLSIDGLPSDLEAATEVVVSGRVLDDRGTVHLRLDDEEVAVGEGGEFRISRELMPGRNAWTLVAVDDAGNQTARSVEVMVPVEADVPSAEPPLADSGPAGPATAPTTLPAQATRPRRFADRGDGTLVDRLAGLVWTKRTSGAEVRWKEARSHCRGLELGRHEDWIQPTIEELEELYRAGELRFPSIRVWSAKKSRSAAWAFDFGSGQRLELSLREEPEPTAQALCRRRPSGPGFREGRLPEDGAVSGTVPLGAGDPSGGDPRGGRGGGGGGRGNGGGGNDGGGGGNGGGGGRGNGGG